MVTKKRILITGGTGLVGSRLTELLSERGDVVSHLSRSKANAAVPTFVWNVDKQTIDNAAFDDVDTIIHLAGAGVGDERWTPKRKKEILESRTHSTELLHTALRGRKHSVKAFVSASAIGFYGFAQTQELVENSAAGSDFLANVTRQWEEKVAAITDVVPREVRLRIGIVLSEKGGALKELANPVKYFVGAPLGSGDQYLSWIHLDDLCRMFIKAVDDETMRGPYNAVAPNPVTNRELTRTIAQTLHRPLIIPQVPAFVLKLVLGEMATMVLGGSRVSAKKILDTGFHFRFTTVESAVEDLLGHS